MNTHTEKLFWGEFGQEREAERDGELLFITMRRYVSLRSDRNVGDHSEIKMNVSIFIHNRNLQELKFASRAEQISLSLCLDFR